MQHATDVGGSDLASNSILDVVGVELGSTGFPCAHSCRTCPCSTATGHRLASSLAFMPIHVGVFVKVVVVGLVEASHAAQLGSGDSSCVSPLVGP
jgi:hypothetical protein